MNKKMDLKQWMFGIFGICLVAGFPGIFLYSRNASEANFSEVLPVLLLLCGCGAVVFLCSVVVVRSVGKGFICAALITAVITNFALLEKALKLFFPNLKYWHTAPILMMLALHLAWLLCKLVKEDTATMIVQVVTLTFGVLVVINLATSIPSIIARVQANRELEAIQQVKREEYEGKNEAENPNIYLLIFDEYANFPQMERFYNYDNAPLRDYLKKNNFNISYTSRNEATATEIVLTNLMNIDYVVGKDTPSPEKEVLRKNGKLYSIMREHGYSVQTFDIENFMSDDTVNVSEGRKKSTTVNGETLSDLIIMQSIVYPFFSKDPGDAIAKILEMADYLSSEFDAPQSNTFTTIYFDLPHQPFLVDENGQPVSALQSSNWEDLRYYLGQYKFTTKLMIRILTHIIEEDPKAIVILQSDHGARASTCPEMYEKFTYEVMVNPLETVYCQGEKLEIEGLSSVNVMRTVLNHVLDMNLEILNVPVIK